MPLEVREGGGKVVARRWIWHRVNGGTAATAGAMGTESGAVVGWGGGQEVLEGAKNESGRQVMANGNCIVMVAPILPLP